MTLLARNLSWTSPMSCLMHMCKLGSVVVDCLQGVCLLVTVFSLIILLCAVLQSCGGSKKGIVYDFFFQYCPAVLVTNSAHWVNFDAGFDSSCTGKLCSHALFLLLLAVLHPTLFSTRCNCIMLA